jgi:hypothetical protein
MSMNQKAANDPGHTPGSQSSSPQTAGVPVSTGVILKSDVRRATTRPPWDAVERYYATGGREHREWIEAFACADPDFAHELDLRRCTARPPWELVERYLRTGKHHAWVEDHEARSPAFAEVLAAMREDQSGDDPADDSPPSTGRVISLAPRLKRAT